MPKTDKNEIVEEEIVISKPVTKCTCNGDIGRNIRCPDHGDSDKKGQ